MYVKITQSGPRRYVQLVESYRDATGRVKKRTVATLGRLDRLSGDLDSVINGLLKATGREALTDPPPPAVSFDSARALGDVWALTELWKSLGFHHLRQVFRSTRHRIDVEALIRVMVFNRLCDPDSKLGVLRSPGDRSTAGHEDGLDYSPAVTAQHGCADRPSARGRGATGPAPAAAD